MGRRRQYHGLDVRTEYRMVMYEFVLVCILLATGLAAVVLVAVGLSTDLTSGNRSLELKVLTVQNHTQPTFTFCPVGEVEDQLPPVWYCSFSFELSIKEDAEVEREWGDLSDDCPGDMQAQGIDIWEPHPLDPACWVLGPDPNGALIPLRGTENMFLVFNAEGIGMRVWNSTEDALSNNPANSTESQGIRIIFGSGDLVQLKESTFTQLGGEKETSYELNQFGSFPLQSVGATNVSIVVVTWESDQVLATNEKESISVLTLTAIILGAVAVALDLIFKNFCLLFYQLFVYQPREDGTKMQQVEM